MGLKWCVCEKQAWKRLANWSLGNLAAAFFCSLVLKELFCKRPLTEAQLCLTGILCPRLCDCATFSRWSFNEPPAADGLRPHLARSVSLIPSKSQRKTHWGAFLTSSCPAVSLPGMYLSDLTYIDSAYPSTGSILESEQRSNLMNNLLRIISDLQRSCTYGKCTFQFN